MGIGRKTSDYSLLLRLQGLGSFAKYEPSTFSATESNQILDLALKVLENGKSKQEIVAKNALVMLSKSEDLQIADRAKLNLALIDIEKGSAKWKPYKDEYNDFLEQYLDNEEKVKEVNTLREMEKAAYDELQRLLVPLKTKCEHIGKTFGIDFELPELLTVFIPSAERFQSKDSFEDLHKEIQRLIVAETGRSIEIGVIHAKLITSVEFYKNAIIRLKNSEKQINAKYDDSVSDTSLSVRAEEMAIEDSRAKESKLEDDIGSLVTVLSGNSILPDIKVPSVVEKAFGESDDTYLPRLKTRLQNLEKEHEALETRLGCLKKNRKILLERLNEFQRAQELKELNNEVSLLQAGNSFLRGEGGERVNELMDSVVDLAAYCDIDIRVSNYCVGVPIFAFDEKRVDFNSVITGLRTEKDQLSARNETLKSACEEIKKLNELNTSITQEYTKLQRKDVDDVSGLEKELLQGYHRAKRFGRFRVRDKSFYDNDAQVEKEIKKVARKVGKRNIFGNVFRKVSKGARRRAAYQNGLASAYAITQAAPISTKNRAEQIACYAGLVAKFNSDRAMLANKYSAKFKTVTPWVARVVASNDKIKGAEQEIREGLNKLFTTKVNNYAAISAELELLEGAGEIASTVFSGCGEAIRGVPPSAVDGSDCGESALPSEVGSMPETSVFNPN